MLGCQPLSAGFGAVTLNPERDCVIKAHSYCNNIQRLAA